MWIRDTSEGNKNKPVNLALVREIKLKDKFIYFSYDASSPDTVWEFKEKKDTDATYKYIISGMKGI